MQFGGEEKAPRYGTFHKRNGEGCFTRQCSDRTRGNDFKLKEDQYRLDLRQKLFTMRVVN